MSFWSLSQKRVSGRTPEITAIRAPFSFGLWMVASSSLKRLTYALKVSCSPYLMLARRLKGVAYFLAPWNRRMNSPKSCVQEATVLGSICLNHFFTVAVNVTVKHRHRARDETWSRSSWSLKASRWSEGPSFLRMLSWLAYGNPYAEVPSGSPS